MVNFSQTRWFAQPGQFDDCAPLQPHKQSFSYRPSIHMKDRSKHAPADTEMVATRRSSRLSPAADPAVPSGDVPTRVGQEPICVYTAEETSRHNSPADCWVIIRGQARTDVVDRSVALLPLGAEDRATSSALQRCITPLKSNIHVWQVYDVTRWVPHHPGGHLITIQAGRDCTQLFNSYHPASAR